MVRGRLLGSGGDLQIFGGFQDFLNSGAGGGALGIHDENPGDGHHGVEDNGKVAQKGNDFSGLGQTCVDPIGAHHDDQSEAQVQKQVHHGVGQSHGDAGFFLSPDQFPVDACKAFPFIIGFGQGLDDPDSGDIFPDGTHHGVHALLQLHIQRNAPFGDAVHQQCQEGQGANQNQCEHRVQGEGDENSAQ